MSNKKYQYDYFLTNTKIQTNLLEAAKTHKIKKTMFLGSSCIYPKKAPNPLKESYLMGGYLEKTNEAYALSKIGGLKLSEYMIKEFNMDIRCFMPCNLFGFNDNFFDKKNNHVLPALIHKIYESKINNKKKFTLWGNGNPKREFLHADNLAEYLIEAMKVKKCNFYKNISKSYFYNIGSDLEISITKLAKLIMKILNYDCNIKYDLSKPNGTMRKFLSKAKIKKIIKIKKFDFEKKLNLTIKHYIDLRNKL